MTLEELLSKTILGLSGVSSASSSIYEIVQSLFTDLGSEEQQTEDIIDNLNKFIEGLEFELDDDGNYYLVIDDSVLIEDGYIIIN